MHCSVKNAAVLCKTIVKESCKFELAHLEEEEEEEEEEELFLHIEFTDSMRSLTVRDHYTYVLKWLRAVFTYGY